MWTHFCVQLCEIFYKLVPSTSLTDEVMNYVLENLMGQFLKRLEINSETEMSMFINLNLLYR